jgi:CelD/BcsL family acetyltransferase involved in cellulose biosynthesis
VSGVVLRSTRDRTTWDDLVRGATGALPFHDWDWLDLQEQVLGVGYVRLLVLVEDEPIGVLPVPRSSPRSPTSPMLPYPFLGPLVPAEWLLETLRAFRRWQWRHGLVVGRMEFGPDVTDAARTPLRAAGFGFRESRSVSVDLTHGSTEEMFRRFTKDRRRDVRRAVRDGASVRPAAPGELTSLLSRVLKEAYQSHGVANPYPEHTGRLFESWASGRDDVSVFTALVDDEPAGVQVGLGGHPTAIAWVGASLRRFRDANVNSLLYLRVMEWALEQGCKKIDFCAVVDPGVARYKLAFGGVERPYLLADSTLIPQKVRLGLRDARDRLSR